LRPLPVTSPAEAGTNARIVNAKLPRNTEYSAAILLVKEANSTRWQGANRDEEPSPLSLSTSRKWALRALPANSSIEGNMTLKGSNSKAQGNALGSLNVSFT
jgi:hypothetical protein